MKRMRHSQPPLRGGCWGPGRQRAQPWPVAVGCRWGSWGLCPSSSSRGGSSTSVSPGRQHCTPTPEEGSTESRMRSRISQESGGEGQRDSWAWTGGPRPLVSRGVSWAGWLGFPAFQGTLQSTDGQVTPSWMWHKSRGIHSQWSEDGKQENTRTGHWR